MPTTVHKKFGLSMFPIPTAQRIVSCLSPIFRSHRLAWTPAMRSICAASTTRFTNLKRSSSIAMRLLLDGEQTPRLICRSIQLSDFDTWLEFFKDPETHRHWIADRSSPEQECREWYSRQQQRYENDEGGMNALIEKSTGKLVGHCGLLRQSVDGVKELEIGY